MRPIHKLAVALWVAVFLFAGIRFGSGWFKPAGPEAAASQTPALHAPTPEAATPAAAAEAPRVLPPISLKDLKGEPRAIAEWSGRTLVINFWATWCAPCRKEMPLLERFQSAQDPAELQVIGIAIDRLDPVLRFLGETGVTYPNLAGEMDATRAAEQFGDAFVGALPFSVVAAPDGTILAVRTGELHASDLEQIAAVASALADGSITPVEAKSRLRLGSPGA